MFDTINGIPLHPLVVHAVVVLLPLAVLGTIAIALVPRWRRPYGPLVFASALVATVLVPVSTQSGEAFERRVGSPGVHQHLGEQLFWYAIPLTVLLLVLVVLDRRRSRRGDGAESGDRRRAGVESGDRRRAGALVTVVAVLAVIAAVANGVQVYRVGDSGAKAAWGEAGARSAE